jgi:hypothetical protein
VRVAVASAELERDDGEAKPLHAYYQHLLQYRNGQLSKPHRPWFLRVSCFVSGFRSYHTPICPPQVARSPPHYLAHPGHQHSGRAQWQCVSLIAALIAACATPYKTLPSHPAGQPRSPCYSPVAKGAKG